MIILKNKNAEKRQLRQLVIKEKADKKLSASGDPDWIRTNDPQLRRLMLYPTELPNQ
jgi:hypothetical protein